MKNFLVIFAPALAVVAVGVTAAVRQWEHSGSGWS